MRPVCEHCKSTNHTTEAHPWRPYKESRMTVTREQYEAAVQAKKDAEETINAFHRKRLDDFDQRLKDNPIFTDEELFYSATALCPCGHGLAYPKECGFQHYWDCSAILKGIADPNVEHTGRLPFAFYDVKGESVHRGTTRGVFIPKEQP